MSQRPITKKRLSYSLLAPEGPLVRLDVPPPGYARHFDPRPLLFSSSTGTRVQGTASPGQQRVGSGQASHPKHCLGVSALALDLTTVVLPVDDPAQDLRDDSADSRTPTGILYSAGRDGLMAAWDLGLPTMRRRQRAGMSLQLRQARHERMAELGAFQDDDSFGFEDGLSSDEQSVASDTDSINTGSRHDHRPRRPSRTRKHKSAEEIPYEEKWQIDHSRLDDPKVHKIWLA
jgi:WD repeat-containing protein 48